MKMYKDSMVCNVQKDQIPAMENNGWDREKSKGDEAPEAESPEVKTSESPEEKKEAKETPAVKLAKKRKPIARKTK